MTDLHATQIVNPQRNSNTILQNSTLQSNSNALSKLYSFQSLRSVKGTATLINTDGRSNIDVCLINEYDGSPIQLYPTDTIMSISIYNGNTSFIYPNYYTGTLFKCKYPIPFITGGNIELCITPTPTYSETSQIWIPETSIVTTLCQTSLTSLSQVGGNQIYVPISFNTLPLYSSCIGSINNNSETSYKGNCTSLTCRFTQMSNPIIPPYINQINQIVPTVSVNITLLILNPLSVE